MRDRGENLESWRSDERNASRKLAAKLEASGLVTRAER